MAQHNHSEGLIRQKNYKTSGESRLPVEVAIQEAGAGEKSDAGSLETVCKFAKEKGPGTG